MYVVDEWVEDDFAVGNAAEPLDPRERLRLAAEDNQVKS